MSRGNLFWGLVLIILGGLFFLKATGAINDVLGWFWPAFLIMLGLWVLLGRSLLVINPTGETFSIDLLGAARLDMEAGHGAGSIYFGGGAPTGVALTGTQGLGLDKSSHLLGESLVVKLDAGPTFLPFLGPQGGEWRFNLTQEVPVSIKLDAGASQLLLEMTDVKLTYLGIDAGASSVTIKLPARAGHSLVDIESGAASLDLTVPEGVGARIRFEQAASSINIDEKRFPRLTTAPNLYQSGDYDSASNKVEINLEGGVNSVSLH